MASPKAGQFSRLTSAGSIHSGNFGRRASAASTTFWDVALVQTLGQPVDRIVLLQQLQRAGVENARMDDLAIAVPQFEVAGEPPDFAHRQRAKHPVEIVAEEDQLHVVARIVLTRTESGALE